MAKYTVNQNERVSHNGKLYESGEELSLSAKDAERLLKLNVIVSDGEEEDAPETVDLVEEEKKTTKAKK